jgi:succinate dehydrogenase / fumarate reductase, membrane anchor subunit
MRYLTDRKRADGKGASHTGTAHHWSMQTSAVGLAFLVPSWIYVFGSTLGLGRDAFAQPFPAILTALVIFVGMRHFAKGASMMIEDYSKGSTRKILIIFVVSLSYVITATGLFALIKIAL